MENILSQLSPMKNGKELLDQMTVLPAYDPNILEQSSTVRLMALSDLYNIYVPSVMSVLDAVTRFLVGQKIPLQIRRRSRHHESEYSKRRKHHA